MNGTVTLVDSLARRRLLYPSPVLSTPSVLLIDIPTSMRTPSLPLGRYYFALLETESETAEMERFLAEPRDRLVAPTIFDHRPSLLATAQILISRYEPPLIGWPWVLVCRWPESHVRLCPVDAGDLARGAYSVELFDNEAEMEDAITAVIAQLGERHHLSMRLISGDMLPAVGNA